MSINDIRVPSPPRVSPQKPAGGIGQPVGLGESMAPALNRVSWKFFQVHRMLGGNEPWKSLSEQIQIIQ